MNLCLKRKGNFRAYWINTTGMCGVASSVYDTTRNYNYECLIEADSTELDFNGFIIDQLEINKYFERKYNTGGAVAARSCEQIAIAAVKEVAEMLHAKGHRKVYRIAVTISPVGTEVASMTCEWTKSKDEIKTPVPEPITKYNGISIPTAAPIQYAVYTVPQFITPRQVWKSGNHGINTLFESRVEAFAALDKAREENPEGYDGQVYFVDVYPRPTDAVITDAPWIAPKAVPKTYSVFFRHNNIPQYFPSGNKAFVNKTFETQKHAEDAIRVEMLTESNASANYNGLHYFALETDSTHKTVTAPLFENTYARIIQEERSKRFGIFFTYANGAPERSANLPGEYPTAALALTQIKDYLKHGMDSGYVVRSLPYQS